MSYALMISPCLICGLPFGYNPRYAPSIKDEPVCRHCMDTANAERAEENDPERPPFIIDPRAYEPINEEELP